MITTSLAMEPSSKRRFPRLLASFSVVAALLIAIAATSAPRADAAPRPGENRFCEMRWLAPFGQSGDRCFAGDELWGRLLSVELKTYQRAGCVNYTGWYYEYYTGWVCTGNYSSTGINVPRDGGSYRGVIRNNNLTYSANFTGTEWCCYPYE
jgi:hypothetical protein